MAGIAEQILQIISDYHCDNDSGFVMSAGHINEWANQFDEPDRNFVLQELLHILQQGTYISKAQAGNILHERIKETAQQLRYTSVKDFLNESEFIRTQQAGKSQDGLLKILDEVLQQQYGLTVNTCGAYAKKNMLYVDDIVASNKTLLKETRRWMETEDNIARFKNGEFNFCVLVFCRHTWGIDRLRWSLKSHFIEEAFTNARRFVVSSHYTIQDNLKAYTPSLNLALPIKQEMLWDTYLANIEGAAAYEDRAYRPANKPNRETFFSSIQNRHRFENILVNKGIEIINQIKDSSLKKNHRPLGKTYSHYKTLGTGTLFFTWRNISNTCPVVFWWDNPSHHWKGLFPLQNRGL
jgi:hypothetical protein